ncbi:MAG: periplasmic heavy metal sensor [Chitinophagaceae bacterium]|jgi:hypothetical protein|nr:periplasmic heavy metal sensor [Chitinophagaceae bacterium]
MLNRSNNKVLVLLVVVLLITNLGMLWYFTRPAKEEAKPLTRAERSAEMMRKELGFDEAQAADYLALRARRDSLLQPLNADLRQAKLALLSLLQQPGVADSTVEQAVARVAEKQAPLELAYFRHFQRVRALCLPAQHPGFDSMLVRMVRRNTGDTTAMQPPTRQ